MARASIKRIKRHRTYEIGEAAEIVGVTPQTIRKWGREGLAMLKAQRPFLIRGCDLKDFIGKMRQKSKRPLALGEVYCFTCKAPRKPAYGLLDYKSKSQRHGRLEGFCSACDGPCGRLVSVSELPQWQAVCRIGGSCETQA